MSDHSNKALCYLLVTSYGTDGNNMGITENASLPMCFCIGTLLVKTTVHSSYHKRSRKLKLVLKLTSHISTRANSNADVLATNTPKAHYSHMGAERNLIHA